MNIPFLFSFALYLLACVLSRGDEMRAEQELLIKCKREGIKCRHISSDVNGYLTVDMSGGNIYDLTLLKGLLICSISLRETEVTDISPLAGMPITNLDLSCTRVADLAVLHGMPLQELNLELTPVATIESLRGLPVAVVILRETNIQSLEPLTNSPVRILDIVRTKVNELAPLRGMPLEVLRFSPERIVSGIEMLRDIKTLKYIGNLYETIPVEAFWLRYDAGQFRSGAKDPSLASTQLDFLEILKTDGGLKDDHLDAILNEEISRKDVTH